jgi:hypothetical protein
MPAPSREITLDQLRAPINSTAEATPGASALADSQLTAANDPLQALDTMMH